MTQQPHAPHKCAMDALIARERRRKEGYAPNLARSALRRRVERSDQHHAK
jgi:hypothetical protein